MVILLFCFTTMTYSYELRLNCTSIDGKEGISVESLVVLSENTAEAGDLTFLCKQCETTQVTKEGHVVHNITCRNVTCLTLHVS